MKAYRNSAVGRPLCAYNFRVETAQKGGTMRAYRNSYGDACWTSPALDIWMRLMSLPTGEYELQAAVDGTWESYKFESYAKAHCFLVGLVY